MAADGRSESERVGRARAGDHGAFRALVEPYQRELHGHCYRMTGSHDDADDLVQETLFRAWRGLGTYVSRGSFRGWLYRIATNTTLNLIDSAPRRREMINSAGEPPWLQPYPPTEGDRDPADFVEQLETVGLAFVVAFQNLPGRQRSALLLCDVLGFSPAEAAEILDCSVPAANSVLQRARSTMATVLPVASPAPSEEQRRYVDRFVDAWRAADTDALLGLLQDTVHLTMPPHALEWFGSAGVLDVLMEIAPDRDPSLLRFLGTRANGEQGFATYVRVPGTDSFARHCVMFFGSATVAVGKITGFTEDRVFDILNLPMTVDISSSGGDGAPA